MTTPVRNRTKAEESVRNVYPAFQKVNGEHPFKTQVPDGRVEYKARKKKGGKVAFFHFELAKEMGLLPKDHPHKITPELEKAILDTFSIVIINEYDIQNKIKFPEDEILPHTYMATRYLQIQHPDKSGRTSGDGRTVWNGSIRHNGVTWDISSCGTGATCLSPATNIFKKYFQTGDPSISYGCGLSEIDEGLETLFFSEIFNKNNLKTERILAIIEFEKGLAINVRANPNLIRPSHFFGHLKQSNYKTLKQVTDYYIGRQIENKVWEDTGKWTQKEKYQYLAKFTAKTFAEMAARFEDDYIFCWLDWDGDNILMDGGIIDYGSIRQFGLFHSEYRYDDVQRFSTTILEQKQKARYMVQSFAQISDYLITGKKKPIGHFKHSVATKLFDDHFIFCKNRNLLQKIGFKKNQIDFLLQSHTPEVQKFRKVFSFFEREKSKKGVYKVADGITRDAIFCMRDILRELPQLYLTRGSVITHEEFIEIMASSYAKKHDLRATVKRKKLIDQFQSDYMRLIKYVAQQSKTTKEHQLLEVTMRSSVINKYERVTGDSIYFVVEKVKKFRPKLKPEEIFTIMSDFRQYQNLNPDQKANHTTSAIPEKQRVLIRGLHHIVRECREGL